MDLGSGGGINVFMAAKQVGKTGTVYGLDMMEEMLTLARCNQEKMGIENVEFICMTKLFEIATICFMESANMDILIRSMNENDWSSVSDIYRQEIKTRKATFQSDIPAYNEWDAAHIQECRFVAVHDRKVVGWTALSKVSSRCVYGGVAEVSIYIAAEARGKRIGKQLLNQMILESEKLNFGSFNLALWKIMNRVSNCMKSAVSVR